LHEILVKFAKGATELHGLPQDGDMTQANVSACLAEAHAAGQQGEDSCIDVGAVVAVVDLECLGGEAPTTGAAEVSRYRLSPAHRSVEACALEEA
jgi:hypothetical protein